MVDNSRNRRDQGQEIEYIGFMEEGNEAVREKMCEMGSLCQEGACPPWIQILLE